MLRNESHSDSGDDGSPSAAPKVHKDRSLTERVVELRGHVVGITGSSGSHSNKSAASGSDSLEEALRTGVASSLETTLRDQEACGVFYGYLLSIQALENLLFWIEVEMFRSYAKNQPSKARRRRRANKIFVDYFDPDSPLEVNIPGSVLDDLAQNMAAQHAPSNVFDVAQAAVYETMAQDSFPEYLHSPPFNEYYQRRSKEIRKQIKHSRRRTVLLPLLPKRKANVTSVLTAMHHDEPSDEPDDGGAEVMHKFYKSCLRRYHATLLAVGRKDLVTATAFSERAHELLEARGKATTSSMSKEFPSIPEGFVGDVPAAPSGSPVFGSPMTSEFEQSDDDSDEENYVKLSAALESSGKIMLADRVQSHGELTAAENDQRQEYVAIVVPSGNEFGAPTRPAPGPPSSGTDSELDKFAEAVDHFSGVASNPPALPSTDSEDTNDIETLFSKVDQLSFDSDDPPRLPPSDDSSDTPAPPPPRTHSRSKSDGQFENPIAKRLLGTDIQSLSPANFDWLRAQEKVIGVYGCSLRGARSRLLYRGKMVLTNARIQFCSKISKLRTRLRIPVAETIWWYDVLDLSADSSARVIPDAITVRVAGRLFSFSGFMTRDDTLEIARAAWVAANQAPADL